MDLDRAIQDQLKGGAIRLPPYPATALKLGRILRDPTHHLAQVLEVVKADALLCAAVLRVANSAMWTRLGEVTTLSAAIGRIGEAELSRLALASGLSSELTARGPLGRIRRQIWHNSISAAVCAGVVAPALGLDDDELFVAGLLHDIGRTVTLNVIEGLLRQNPDEPSRTAGAWWRLVERYHVELGLILATKWQLPEVFVECISQHHQSSPAGRYSRQVVAIAAVDQLVDVLNSGVPLSGAVLASMLVVSNPAEYPRLAAELSTVPSMIAGFEDPLAAEPMSKVTREPATRAAVAPTGALRIHLPNGVEARCLSASATEVAFTSPSPMTENFLQRVDVALPDQRFSVWLRVAACTPTLGAFEVSGHPFALAGRALAGWLSVTSDGVGLV